MPRLPTTPVEPDGLVYRPGFLTDDDQQDLLRRLQTLAYDVVQMRGQTAKRTVRHFGYRYPPGAPIGWHRDAPTFGPAVAGVSLGSACRMRFQRKQAGVRQVHEIALAAGSAYVLRGPARSAWQHSIPPVPELRYSVTFRMLRPSR